MNLRIPEELNEITLTEFFDMADLYFFEESHDQPRQATQADIDQFFG